MAMEGGAARRKLGGSSGALGRGRGGGGRGAHLRLICCRSWGRGGSGDGVR
jgi:hypothetical protein